jgi:predicted RNase H-like HicB family nuclease
MSEQKLHAVVYRDNESGQWTAWCLEYDVASQGDTLEHAMEMIKEAVELHIEDMTDEQLEDAFIPVDSTPVVREFTVRAPKILHG